MRVFVTSQMRTGSTWLCDVLCDVLSIGRWNFWKNGSTIKPNRFAQEIKRRVNNVIKLHWALPKTISEQIPHNNKQNFVLSITRDVRDIAVSMAMYARYDSVVRNSPRLKPINDVRKLLNNRLTDKQYVNNFIKTDYFKNAVIHNWKLYNDGYTHPNYMLVHYEDLINRPMITLKSITVFLNVNLKANRIKNILNNNSFKSKTRRDRGTGDNKAFRRIGIVGDYHNYLTPDSLQIIEELLNK